MRSQRLGVVEPLPPRDACPAIRFYFRPPLVAGTPQDSTRRGHLRVTPRPAGARSVAEKYTPTSGPLAQAVARKNGKESTMDARLDYLSSPLTMKVVRHIYAAAAVLRDSALPTATQGPVKLRASQINGCGLCTDMRTKDA